MGTLQALIRVREPGAVFTSTGFSVFVIDPADATCGITVDSDGTVYVDDGGVPISDSTWLVIGAASDYKIKATYVSGSVPAGTMGSEVNGDSSPRWYVTQTVVGSTTATFLIEILKDGGVVASGNVTIMATVDP